MLSQTNFNQQAITWVEKAKNLGYHIELHFYCLDSKELAKKRVASRTRKKGHYVKDETVVHKWKEGYKNLNLHYHLFDFILLIDNSSSKKPLQNLFSLYKDHKGSFKVERYHLMMPKYAKRRFPAIYKILVKASIKNRMLSLLWGFQRSPLAR